MTPDNLNTRLHNQDTASALSILWSCSEQWTLCVFVCFFFFLFFIDYSLSALRDVPRRTSTPTLVQYILRSTKKSVHDDMFRKMMLLQSMWMMVIFNDDQILLKPTIAIDPLSIIKHDWYACSEQAADTDSGPAASITRDWHNDHISVQASILKLPVFTLFTFRFLFACYSSLLSISVVLSNEFTTYARYF